MELKHPTEVYVPENKNNQDSLQNKFEFSSSLYFLGTNMILLTKCNIPVSVHTMGFRSPLEKKMTPILK
jgi:hypothetical protein